LWADGVPQGVAANMCDARNGQIITQCRAQKLHLKNKTHFLTNKKHGNKFILILTAYLKK